MQPTESLDGRGLLRWAETAAADLSERRAEINALNVFPVPDADTGSNMAYTMEAAVAQARAAVAKDPTLADDAEAIATALSVGSVRGARGNSGLVLSQVMRGLSQSAKNKRIDGAALTATLKSALAFISRAISEPVEGTVITVLRAASIAAEMSVDSSLAGVTRAATEAARIALANTPSQLKVLRDAGVVDAGGQGLVILLETLLREVEVVDVDKPSTDPTPTASFQIAEQIAALRSTPAKAPAPVQPVTQDPNLELLFIAEDCEVAALSEAIAPLGDSLVVADLPGAEEGRAAKIHIHSRRPGEVIEQACAMAKVSKLRIEVLPETGQGSERIVLAITPPGALAELYASAGATVVTRASEVGDMVSAVAAEARENNASEVILLPNGMLDKQELADIEQACRAFKREINILPTGYLVRGLPALAVHDPGQPLAVDAYTMAEASAAMRTAELTLARSKRNTPAGECQPGDIVATWNLEVLAVGDCALDTLVACLVRLLETGGEQITLLVQSDFAQEITEESVRAALPEKLRDVEIAVYPAENARSLVEIGVE